MNYILFICIFSSIVFGQSFVPLNGKNLEEDIVNQNKKVKTQHLLFLLIKRMLSILESH